MKRSALDQFVEKLLTNPGAGEEQTDRCDPSPTGLVAQLLSMPLDRFEREGAPMEIKIPWFDKTLWFVPGEAEAGDLVKEGVHRGRIWTGKELRDLLAIPSMTREPVKKVATAKAIFEGTVTA